MACLRVAVAVACHVRRAAVAAPERSSGRMAVACLSGTVAVDRLLSAAVARRGKRPAAARLIVVNVIVGMPLVWGSSTDELTYGQ